MTDLPDKTHLTSSGASEAQFQGAIGALYDFVAEMVTGSAPTITPIVLGSITPTSTFITVDTENDTSTDDLTTAVPTNIGAKVIFMRPESSARAVTIKHLAGGTGQFYMNGAADVVLNHVTKLIVFYYNDDLNRWEELWRNWGLYTTSAGDKSSVRTEAGLGSAATKDTGTLSGQVPTNADLGALSLVSQITSLTQIANLLITGSKMANGTLAISKFANDTPNSIYRTNESGVPELLTAPGNTTTWMRGDLSFASIPAGITSIGQGELRTLIGGVSVGTNQAANLVLPGGSYGFYPQLRRVSGSGTVGAEMAFHAPLGTSFVTTLRLLNQSPGEGGSSGTGSVAAQQRYISASPPFTPYDDGGQAAGFLYLLINADGTVASSYFADVPSWAYNGPTDISPDYIDEWGLKYKAKKQTRLQKIIQKKGKSGICPSETMTFDDKVWSATYGMTNIDEIKKVKQKILNDEYVVITEEMKNSDRHLIPHPFLNKDEDQTVVLVGLYDDLVYDLTQAQNEGDDVIKLIMEGHLYPDLTNFKKGKTVGGVKLADLKVR